MAEGDAMWAGHMVSFSILTHSLSLSKQLRQQDRRVEETDAAWRYHYDALAAHANGVVADYNALLDWAKAVASERDAALARVAELERALAEQAEKHAFALDLARKRSARLDAHVELLLEQRRAG